MFSKIKSLRKRALLVQCLLVISCLNITAQLEKVKVNYLQDDIDVILDGVYKKTNPSELKIDFNINKELIFISRGYYSKHIELDADEVFTSLTIDLTPVVKEEKSEKKNLLLPDTLVLKRTVTNFTRQELVELINQNFLDHNFVIGHEINLFHQADSEIKDARYKIAAEVLESNQVKSIYKKPRFVVGSIKIRWTLFDTQTNKIVLHKITDGAHIAHVAKTKGLVSSELMKKMMIEAIEEAQDRLFNEPDFKSAFT